MSIIGGITFDHLTITSKSVRCCTKQSQKNTPSSPKRYNNVIHTETKKKTYMLTCLCRQIFIIATILSTCICIKLCHKHKRNINCIRDTLDK